MAVKKKTTTRAKNAAPRKKAAVKKLSAPAKAVRAGSAVPVKAATASKAGTPRPGSGTKKKAAVTKAAVKKAPIKLTDRQLDLLRTVHGTRDHGYLADKKTESKTLDALAGKKLIKRGAKDKASGHVRYRVSKAGAKHVASSPSA